MFNIMVSCELAAGRSSLALFFGTNSRIFEIVGYFKQKVGFLGKRFY